MNDFLNINASFDAITKSIKVTVVNKNTYECYEATVTEKDNIQRNFDIEGLYNFFMKCLNFEDGHKYTFTINQIYMKISMDAVFNTYFHMNYDIKLNKKILSSEELLNNVTSALVKQDKKIEELTNENELLKKEFNNLKKENEKLMTKIDYLYKDYEINISLLSNAEISIGLMKNQQNQMSSIHISIGIETLKFNLTGYIFTLYFDKIKLLTEILTSLIIYY